MRPSAASVRVMLWPTVKAVTVATTRRAVPAASRSATARGASGWARATRRRPRTSTATTPGRMADLTPATVVLDKPKTPAVSQPGAVRSRRPRARFDGRRHDAALAADRDARAVRELRPAPEPILRGPAHPHQVLRRCLHLRDARRAARRVRVRARGADRARRRQRGPDEEHPDRPPTRLRRRHRPLGVLRRGPALRHTRLSRLRRPDLRAAAAEGHAAATEYPHDILALSAQPLAIDASTLLQ